MRSLVISTVAAIAAVTATSARAAGPAPSSKQVCADAYAAAQPLRDAHKLIEARGQLRLCAQSSCPSFIVTDCASWLADAESRIPTVVLTAHDGAGNALVDVAVSLDGAPLRARLDGQSVDVDAGAHTFTFATGDGTKMSRTIVIEEGRKAQSVSVTFGGATAASPTPSPSPTDAPGFWTTRHEVGAAVAGVGVAGIIVGAIFGGLTLSAVSAQKSDCGAGPTCANHAKALSDHSSGATDSAVSTAGFIGGAVIAAGGGYLLFTGGRKAESAKTPSAWTLVPALGRDGGGAALRMVF